MVVALPVGGAQVGTERPAGVAGRVEVRRVVTAAAANVDLAAQLEPQPRHRQHRVVAVHRQRLAPVAVVVAPLAEFAAKAGTLVARPLQAKGGGVGEDAGGPRLQRCISVVVAGFRAGTPVVVEAPAGGGPVRGRIVGKWTGAAIVAACGLDLPFQTVMAEMQANAVAQVAHARRGVVELGPLLRAEGAKPPAIAQQRRSDGKRVPAVAAAQRRCGRGTISVAAAPVERCLDLPAGAVAPLFVQPARVDVVRPGLHQRVVGPACAAHPAQFGQRIDPADPGVQVARILRMGDVEPLQRLFRAATLQDHGAQLGVEVGTCRRHRGHRRQHRLGPARVSGVRKDHRKVGLGRIAVPVGVRGARAGFALPRRLGAHDPREMPGCIGVPAGLQVRVGQHDLGVDVVVEGFRCAFQRLDGFLGMAGRQQRITGRGKRVRRHRDPFRSQPAVEAGSLRVLLQTVEDHQAVERVAGGVGSLHGQRRGFGASHVLQPPRFVERAGAAPNGQARHVVGLHPGRFVGGEEARARLQQRPRAAGAAHVRQGEGAQAVQLGIVGGIGLQALVDGKRRQPLAARTRLRRLLEGVAPGRCGRHAAQAQGHGDAKPRRARVDHLVFPPVNRRG